MSDPPPGIIDALASQGYVLVPGVLPRDQIPSLVDAIEHPPSQADKREKSGGSYAMRNLLRVPAIHEWSNSREVRQLIDPILGKGAFPARGILFDKTAGANWKVAWHQDISIAVKNRKDVPGFGPWSVKAGVAHVQPPAWVLENMLTLRLHLDECDEQNGPLMVLPSSHNAGVLSSTRIAELRAESAPVSVSCPAGGVLLMRPLLLHASSQALRPRHRRVIHIDYAAQSLPGGLEWFERTSQSTIASHPALT